MCLMPLNSARTHGSTGAPTTPHKEKPDLKMDRRSEWTVFRRRTIAGQEVDGKMLHAPYQLGHAHRTTGAVTSHLSDGWDQTHERQQVLERLRRQGSSCAVLGMPAGAATVESSVEAPQTTTDARALCSSNPTSAYLSKYYSAIEKKKFCPLKQQG